MSAAPKVARLFVAVPVPRPVAAALARIGPPAQDGVRPIAAGDLHVTLHFLGNAETAPVRECLRTVRAPPFRLRPERPGCFYRRGGQCTLWVGMASCAGLVALHEATGAALGGVGFAPETRDYRPHITLARLTGRAPRRLVETFENQQLEDRGLEFDCDQFALLESKTAPTGARYRVVESFRLGVSG